MEDEILEELKSIYGEIRTAKQSGDVQYAEELEMSRKELTQLLVKTRKQQSPIEHAVSGTINQIGSGALAGENDELAGFVGAVGGDDYNMERDIKREGMDLFQEDIGPIPSFLLEAGGAMIGPGKFAGKTDDALSMGDEAWRLAKEGGAVGAVEGFGHSTADSIEGILGDMTTSAALGGLFNPVASGLLAAGSATKNFIKNKWKSWTTPDQQKAEAAIQSALEETGMDADDVMEVLDQLGPEATLMDVNDHLRQLALGVSRKNPEAQQQVLETVRERQAGAGGRIADEIDESVGATQPYLKEKKGVDEANKKSSDVLYGELEDLWVDNDDWMKNFLAQPRVQKLLEGVETDFSILNEPSSFNHEMIRVELLDKLKQRLDGLGKPVVGQEKNPGRSASYQELARQLRDKIDEVAPEYGAARKNFETHTKLTDAADIGETVGTKTGIKLDNAIDEMAEFDVGQQDIARLAVADSVQRQIPTQKTANKASKLLQEGDMEKRIDMIDTPDGRLRDVLEAENTFSESYKMVDPNIGSKTHVGMASEDAVSDSMNRGLSAVKESIMFGSPLTTGAKMAVEILENAGKLSPAVGSKVAKILTEKGMTLPKLRALLKREGLTPDEMASVITTWQMLKNQTSFGALAPMDRLSLTGTAMATGALAE